MSKKLKGKVAMVTGGSGALARLSARGDIPLTGHAVEISMVLEEDS